MLEKLVIGAAQFGLPYGINNTSTKPLSRQKVHEILECASNFNINEIDLAENYGNVYEKLKNFDLSNFQITTKISIQNSSESLYDYFSKKIDYLRINSFKSILIHNPEDLYSKDINKLISDIEKIRELGITQKIGISVYNFNEILQARKIFSPEVIQLPYNFFNRNTLNKVCSNKDREEIYIRSIFLQGALLKSKTRKLIELKNKNIKEFKIYDNYLLQNDYSHIQGALSTVLDAKGINKIIIGIDGKEQLLEIINQIKKLKKPVSIPKIKVKDELADPRLW